MSLDFYDSSGDAVAYTDDNEHIYLFNGEPAAYVYKDSVYSYSGSHLGWFADRLIRDHSGDTVFFTPTGKRGPIKPLRHVNPLKGLKCRRPLKSLRELAPSRSYKSQSWSTMTGESFFEL